MSNTEGNVRYLTPTELSDRYHGRISPRTLSNWRCAGTGPKFVKLGGRILYPVAEVEAWEARRTAESTAAYRA